MGPQGFDSNFLPVNCTFIKHETVLLDPNGLYCKLHEIWPFDSQQNHSNCCHHWSQMKADMHQIRFRLGLRLTPRLVSLKRSSKTV